MVRIRLGLVRVRRASQYAALAVLVVYCLGRIVVVGMVRGLRRQSG